MELHPQPDWRLRSALLVSSIALASCSVQGNNPLEANSFDSGLFHTPQGCQIELEEVPVINEQGEKVPPPSEEQVRDELKDTDAPMENRDNLPLKALNGNDTLRYFKDETFQVRNRFELRNSGYTIEVLTDSPDVTIDEEAFANILMLPLDRADDYKQPNLRRQMQCYRKAMFEDRAYAGEYIHIRIPNATGMCFTEDLALAPVGICKELVEAGIDERYFAGSTLPDITVKRWGLELVHNSTMLLLTTEQDRAKAGARADKTLLHEGGHMHWWENGGPLRLDNSLEQPIDAMEHELHTMLKEEGKSLPRAIFYN